jgi:hypothetical protein
VGSGFDPLAPHPVLPAKTRVLLVRRVGRGGRPTPLRSPHPGSARVAREGSHRATAELVVPGMSVRGNRRAHRQAASASSRRSRRNGSSGRARQAARTVRVRAGAQASSRPLHAHSSTAVSGEIAVKDGANGAWVVSPDGTYQCPSRRMRVLDPVGTWGGLRQCPRTLCTRFLLRGHSTDHSTAERVMATQRRSRDGRASGVVDWVGFG